MVQEGLDAFMRGSDPHAVMQSAIDNMSNAERAEFYRDIGLSELVPTTAQRAVGIVGHVSKFIVTLALDKLLGFAFHHLTDYALDAEKPQGQAARDWLYGHGGKFTTVRGKNDILSSPSTLAWLFGGTDNVRNLDLDSGVVGLVGDHGLSNFIIKEHERFKRTDDQALGILQYSDIDFMARLVQRLLLVMKEGKREREEL